MKTKTWLVSATLWLSLCPVAGCKGDQKQSDATDGGDIDAGAETDSGGVTYAIGGAVTGLSGSVILLLNGAEALEVSANGDFTFPTPLADGASYVVSVSQQPDNQLCAVSNAFGAVHGAIVTDIAVACLSDDASLSGLALSTGLLDPGFSPTTFAYAGNVSVVAQWIRVTATAADPGASIEVNGAEVGSGEASEPIALQLGSNVINIEVTAASERTRTYLIAVSRDAIPAESSYLKASNTGTADRFGDSVALSGDTLVVGASYEAGSARGVNGNQNDNGAAASGAVYVFTWNGTAWIQQAYLKASNADASDHFGYSVALFGDTLVVGAQFESGGANGDQDDNSAAASGAVYVFTRSGTTWSQEAYIKASNAEAGDLFGYTVALSADMLAVGAISEDSAATGVNGDQANNATATSGAVYVFRRSGTTWSQEAYVKASNPSSSDGFGSRLALSGDTLAVGSGFEDSSAKGIGGIQTDDSVSNAGAVYVFTGSGTDWSQQAYIKASNTGVNDFFGSAIALFGDTLAVGAQGESSAASGVGGNQADNSALNSGAVYVFTRSGTTWSQQAYVKASNPGVNDTFGYSVALSGDRLAVTSLYEGSSATGVDGNQADNSALSSGAAYLFTRRGTAWSQQAYLKASNTEANDGFGNCAALSDDMLAVAASAEASAATGVDGNQADNSALNSGAMYLFR